MRGHQQRARRALAEPRGEQRRAADLVGDDLLELVGIEDEQLGARRLGRGIRNPRDDAVVARDRRSFDAEALADAGVDGQRPRRVHLHAVRGMKDDAPVADLVAAAFDGERAVGRQRSGGLALLGEVGEQVARRVVVETRVAQRALGLLGGGRRHLAREPAERLAELGRAADAVAVPERHLARLPERGQRR